MAYIRALVMSAYKKLIVSFLNQNIMLWVLKKNVAMRRFF